MTNLLTRLGAAVLVLGLGSVDALAADFASGPTKISPLLLGTALPDAAVQRLDGTATTLKQVVGGKPAVLVFYRGGWCPYCNLQLSQLRLVEKDLQSLGYQVVAISPDRPEELKKTLDKDALNYTLVSDSSANAMKAFGLAYQVDAATLAQYAKYGIDLEKSSGESHHLLP
ncbi:MAG: peroxiredoxin family protein, partial [Rudaea sp.]